VQRPWKHADERESAGQVQIQPEVGHA
jgi:hypothetical protein